MMLLAMSPLLNRTPEAVPAHCGRPNFLRGKPDSWDTNQALRDSAEALKMSGWTSVTDMKTIAFSLPISSGSNHPFPGLPEVKRTRSIGSTNPGK